MGNVRTGWLTLFPLFFPAVAQSFEGELSSSETATTTPLGAIVLDDSFESTAVIEDIELVGNSATSRNVVTSRLLLGVGDLVDETRVQQSRLRLLGTGFFERVEISLRRGSRPGRVVLVIELVERNTITIDGLFIGTSKVSPIFGGVSILESNFFGQGVSAGAGFVAGKERFGIEAHVFVPELEGAALSLSASGLFVRALESLDPNAAPIQDFAYSRAGGRLGLGARVGSAQGVLMSYRLESVNAERQTHLDPKPLRAAPSVELDESILSTLGLSYERDTRDDPLVPRTGSRILLQVEAGTRLLGSSYEFSKYTASGEWAFEMPGTHALRLRVLGGLIQGHTPFFNQFFLSDSAYFALGRDSLPRFVGVNFSAANDYDDLVGSLGVEYVIPFIDGAGWPYHGYVYGGVDVSGTASLDEVQEDPTGRGLGDAFPLSVDLGVRFDTKLGYFSLSAAYVLDLMY